MATNLDGLSAVSLDGLTDTEVREHEAIYFLLAGYCSQIRQARNARRTGSIEKAILLEQEAERKYAALPSELKW